jgi:hypothetical protein
MKKIVIEFPDNFNISDLEAVTAMAAQLYEMGKLSIGQAAQLAGYDKREFIVNKNHRIAIKNVHKSSIETEEGIIGNIIYKRWLFK